jgi:hypothetical protein
VLFFVVSLAWLVYSSSVRPVGFSTGDLASAHDYYNIMPYNYVWWFLFSFGRDGIRLGFTRQRGYGQRLDLPQQNDSFFVIRLVTFAVFHIKGKHDMAQSGLTAHEDDHTSVST